MLTLGQGALCGMSAGFGIMFWITTGSFLTNKSHIPLPFSVEGCLEAFANATMARNGTFPALPRGRVPLVM